jgi:hypothetical protein
MRFSTASVLDTSPSVRRKSWKKIIKVAKYFFLESQPAEGNHQSAASPQRPHAEASRSPSLPYWPAYYSAAQERLASFLQSRLGFLCRKMYNKMSIIYCSYFSLREKSLELASKADNVEVTTDRETFQEEK